MQEFDLGFCLAHHALAIRDDLGRRSVIRRRGNAHVNAEPRGKIHQGMAHVVAVADISQLEAAQGSKALFEREEIRQRLARMESVR